MSLASLVPADKAAADAISKASGDDARLPLDARRKRATISASSPIKAGDAVTVAGALAVDVLGPSYGRDMFEGAWKEGAALCIGSFHISQVKT